MAVQVRMAKELPMSLRTTEAREETEPTPALSPLPLDSRSCKCRLKTSELGRTLAETDTFIPVAFRNALSESALKLLNLGDSDLEVKAKKIGEFISKVQSIDLSALGSSIDLTPFAKQLQAASSHTQESLDRICSRIADLIDAKRQFCASEIRGLASALGGKNGTGMPGLDEVRAANGNKGADKPISVYVYRPEDPAQQRLWTAPCVHPVQCQMLLRKAEGLHYRGDAESISSAIDLLNRLVQRLAFAEKLEPQDALYQAYLSAEPSMLIASLPRTEKQSIRDAQGKQFFKSAAIQQLVHIREQAQNRLETIHMGNNYYGLSADYVPRASYDTMSASLKASLSMFKSIAASYARWNKLVVEQAFSKQDLQNAVQHCDDLEASSRVSGQRLLGMMATTANLIASLQLEFASRRLKVKAAIEKVADKISNAFGGIHLEDIVEAATMLAFSPELPMAGIQGVSLLNKAITQVKDEHGVAIDKSLLVTKIKTVSGNLETIQEGIKQENDGSISLDDAGGAKLIIARDDLKALLDSYKTILAKEDCDPIYTAFQSYIDIVLQRNSAVFRYNACIQAYGQIQMDLAAVRQNVDVVAQNTTRNGIAYARNAATLGSLMSQMYDKALLELLRTLFFAQRAYRFMSLENASHGTLIGGPFSATSVEGIESAVLGFETDLQSAYSKFGEDASTFGGETKHGTKTCIVWKLAPEEVETLCSDASSARVVIQIPAAVVGDSLAVNPFAGRADVRINQVQFYVDGDGVGINDRISVKLTHQGNDTIADPQTGLATEFVHDSISAHFEYKWIPSTDASKPAKVADITIDGTMFKSDTKYALPGPFASWEIALQGDESARSKITSAWFEFSGYSYFFAD